MLARTNRSRHSCIGLGIMTMGLTVMVVGLAGCGSYSPAWYSGDGAMYAAPKGGAEGERYNVELPPLNLMEPGRHVFELKNLPNDQMLALLSLDEPSHERLAWLDKGRVRVVLTLIEQESGQTSVKQGHLMEDWSVTPKSWAGQPVDFEGTWFRPKRHDCFTLVVDVWVDQPVENPPTVTATPHVRGGGFKNP